MCEEEMNMKAMVIDPYGSKVYNYKKMLKLNE